LETQLFVAVAPLTCLSVMARGIGGEPPIADVVDGANFAPALAPMTGLGLSGAGKPREI